MRGDELARLADGVLLPGFVGLAAPDWVRARLAAGLGGVVLFGRNIADPDQVTALTATLRAERPDIVIGIDEEGGDVTRLDAAVGSSVPGNYALGVVDDVGLTGEVAAAVGRRLAAVGVTLDLAPVADVNNNPANPVIGVRSFGADSERVGRHTAAFVSGLQRGGVASCAKHFPGHGDTSVDSHLARPTVGPDLDAALSPFRAAVAVGVQAVMTGHLRVPGYGPLPATVNPSLIGGLLRRTLGFAGLVVTDGVEMFALREMFGLAEGAVRALVAGVDAICVGGGLTDERTVTVLRDAVVAAVRAGRLNPERLAASAARIASCGAQAGRPTLPAAAAEAEAARLGLVAARRAVRWRGAVALSPGPPPVLVELLGEPNQAVGRTPWGLAGPLTARRPGTTTVRLEPRDPLPELPRGRPVVAVCRDAGRNSTQQDPLAALVAARPDAVIVEMGLPGPLPAARGQLFTGGASRQSALAAVEVLLGG
jgi:beta-N-acetylhexosaminidase